MGYDFGVPVPGGFHGLEHQGENSSNPYYMRWSNVDCVGTEDSILDCSMKQTDPENEQCCSSCLDRSVAVYCSRFC